jgi:hypothetical protein
MTVEQIDWSRIIETIWYGLREWLKKPLFMLLFTVIIIDSLGKSAIIPILILELNFILPNTITPYENYVQRRL